jgi:hypothetical protein
MHAMEGPFKVFLDLGEFPIERRKARNQHIVVVGVGETGRNETDRRLEPTADPIANDRAAELLCHSKAEPRLGLLPRDL